MREHKAGDAIALSEDHASTLSKSFFLEIKKKYL